MKPVITIFPLLLSFLCTAQNNVTKLTDQLKDTNYGKVDQAKEKLVLLGKAAIPALVDLLKDTSFVKLDNTSDLIYSGADKFYGHGGIVYYDIDWISVRAGWALEEIAFENFGYRNLSIQEDSLMKLHMQGYSSYLKTGYHDVDFKDKTPREQLKAQRLLQAAITEKWWLKNKDSWNRLNALIDALGSSDEQRQGLALQYLRFGETKIEGLTIESYNRELKPLVIKISGAKGREAEQAKLLLDDKEYYWFKSKSK